MTAAATKKRGGDPEVKPTPKSEKSDVRLERALEQGLEESMAGSDPVNIVQPSKSKAGQAAPGEKGGRTVSGSFPPDLVTS